MEVYYEMHNESESELEGVKTLIMNSHSEISELKEIINEKDK